MVRKYPHLLNIRLSNEDLEQISALAEKLEMAPTTLVRKAWRLWYKENGDRVTAANLTPAPQKTFLPLRDEINNDVDDEKYVQLCLWDDIY